MKKENSKTTYWRIASTAFLTLGLVSCAEQQDHSELHTQLCDAAPLKTAFPGRKLDPIIVKSVELIREENYKDASTLINRRLADEPANVGLHILNGMTYEKLAEMNGDTGQLDLAAVGYENALNIDPNNIMALTRLGQLRYKKKQFSDAQESFANALLIKPNDPALLQELAAASYYAYDLPTAEAAIRKAIEAKPDDVFAERSATMIYAAMGDFKTSRIHMEKYKSLVGDDPDTAKVYGRLRDWQKLYKSGRIHLAQDGGTGQFAPFATPDSDDGNGNGGDTEQQTESLSTEALSAPVEGQSADDGGGDGSGDGSGSKAASTPAPTVEPVAEQIVVDCYLLRINERAGTSKGQNILKNLEVTLSPGGYLFGSGRLSGRGTTSKSIAEASSNSSPSSFSQAPVFPTSEKSRVGAGGQTLGQFAPTFTYNNSGRVNFSTFMAGLTWSGLTYNLNIANVTDNRTEVVARPTLHTLVGQQSIFFSGSELVAGLTGDDGGSLVKYPVGLTMVVTPISLENDEVDLEISVEGAEFNDPNPLRQNLKTTVSVGKTRIDTHAKVKLGQTLALGGIYERSEATIKDGFPGLADMPVLQYFFGNEQSISIRRSVVILMTPRSPDTTRKDVQKAMSKADKAPSVKELHERTKDWYSTQPNLVQIFKYLAVDPVVYYSFQNGDILPPSWGDPNAHYRNHWEKTLSFLYY